MVGGGSGMGGGSAGGGMMRVVGRVVARAGVAAGNATSGPNSGPASPASGSKANASQKLNSSSSNCNYLSISSPTCPFNSLPVNNVPISWPGFLASPTSGSSCGDEFDWVAVDGFVEDEKPVGFLDDSVLRSVPSVDEVQNAVSAIQQVFSPSNCSQFVRDKYVYSVGKDIGDCISISPELIHQVASAGSELDWMEPTLHLVNPKTLPSSGTNIVYDAFQLLRTEPTVQKMVVSLSSDKAVWDAVLNNEVVRELRESYTAAVDSTPPSSVASSDDSNEAVNFVKWILDNTKAKLGEVFQNISKLVNELFGQPHKNEATTREATDQFEEKLRASFLLSVVVLLVVVVTRAHVA